MAKKKALRKKGEGRGTGRFKLGGQGSLLPELQDIRLIAVAPLAILLRGFERVQTRRGPVDFLQEWWVRQL